jgi:predicted nuclease with TOPRIM domain
MTNKEFHVLNKLELLEIMRIQEQEYEDLRVEIQYLKNEQEELFAQRAEWQRERVELQSELVELQAERKELQAERTEWQFERRAFQERLDPAIEAKKNEEARQVLDMVNEKAADIIQGSVSYSENAEAIAKQAAIVMQDIIGVYFSLLGFGHKKQENG